MTNLHLAGISTQVTPGAGWHRPGEMPQIPDNITLLAVPPLLSRTEPHRKCLGLPGTKQTLRDRLGQRRADHRSLQNRLELVHRRPAPNHIDRQPGMRTCQSLSGLVLRAGLVGRPRAIKEDKTNGHSL